MTDRARPRPPGSRGLHHVALGARDVERLAAFYRDLVGLAELRRHLLPGGALRSVWLDAEGTVLMIERTEQPLRAVEGRAPGPFLLAFSAGAGGLEGWCETLAAAGVPIESRTEHTIYLRDPEGNRIAFSRYDFVRTRR